VFGDFEDLETGQRFGRRAGDDEEGTDEELEARQDAELARLAKKVSLKEKFNAEFDSGKIHQSSGVMDSEGVGEGMRGGKKVGRKSRKEVEEEDAALDEEERQALLLAAKLKEDQKARNQAEFAEDGDVQRLKFEGFRQVSNKHITPLVFPFSHSPSLPPSLPPSLVSCLASQSPLTQHSSIPLPLPSSLSPSFRVCTCASALRACLPSFPSIFVPPSLWWWAGCYHTKRPWAWFVVGSRSIAGIARYVGREGCCLCFSVIVTANPSPSLLPPSIPPSSQILKANDPVIFSLGWRRFQSVPIFSTEDQNERQRYLKYTPEHMHCFATFYGPLCPPNTGMASLPSVPSSFSFSFLSSFPPFLHIRFHSNCHPQALSSRPLPSSLPPSLPPSLPLSSGLLAFQSLSSSIPGFRVALTGIVLELDSSFHVAKKLKLIGTPCKIFKNTAFISGMFNSDLEVAKFEGTSLPPSLPLLLFLSSCLSLLFFPSLLQASQA